jgi:hypothetical protein
MQAGWSQLEQGITEDRAGKPLNAARRSARTIIDKLVLFAVFAGVLNLFLPIVSGDLYISERSHNFGAVRAGEDLRHEFTLRNLHPWPLRILAVKGGCGCTVPFLGRSIPFTLEPLQAEQLSVSLDTAGKKDAIREEVVITTKDWTCTGPVLSIISLQAEVTHSDQTRTVSTKVWRLLSRQVDASYINSEGQTDIADSLAYDDDRLGHFSHRRQKVIIH